VSALGASLQFHSAKEKVLFGNLRDLALAWRFDGIILPQAQISKPDDQARPRSGQPRPSPVPAYGKQALENFESVPRGERGSSAASVHDTGDLAPRSTAHAFGQAPERIPVLSKLA
jgi:hypothetical protein